MIINLSAVSSGTPTFNSTSLQWFHEVVPGSGSAALLAFVGIVDQERPEILSATYSGQPFQIISTTVGPGGDPFPAGYILGLFGPAAPSGTIVVNFDGYVGVSNGCSVVVSGVDTVSGTLHRGFGGKAVHPQIPDYTIDQDYTVTRSGILFDLCVAQSSNHTTHMPGPDQTKIADLSLFGGGFSVTYRLVNSGTELVNIMRSDCGGPFAATTLTIAELKGL